MTVVILSDLAMDQLSNLGSKRGEAILDHLDRLRTFPLSAPKVTEEGYEGFHQLIVSTYRIIYKFDQDEDLIKIYIVIDVRRQLPDPEYLRFQLF